MYVNIAVLTKTQPHGYHMALVRAVATRSLKLGAPLRMQAGAGVLRHLGLPHCTAMDMHVCAVGVGDNQLGHAMRRGADAVLIAAPSLSTVKHDIELHPLSAINEILDRPAKGEVSLRAVPDFSLR